MKKHLGWMIRLLIAALGVGYILYTLSWSDQVIMPAEYVSVEGRHLGRGEAQPYVVIHEVEDRYYVRFEGSARSGPYDEGWIEKSELGSGHDQPQFKPSFITILRESDTTLLIAGSLLFIPIVLLATLRWWVLMRARGIETSYGRVGRMTLLGYFFNLCMPGTNGGDVMKAFYAAKATTQRADAVVSIGIDRICGLVGLILLVGVLGLFSLDDPLLRKLTITMWVGLGGLVVAAWLYTSQKMRSRLGLGAMIARLPAANTLRNVDTWVSAYRDHLGTLSAAIGISLVIHLSLASAMSLAGFALGVDQSLLYLMSTVPIVLILWSLPVSGPLGLGPLDYVAVQLIVGRSETTAQEALMMFVAFRLYMVGLGLIGSLAMMGLGAKGAKPQVTQEA